jgi:hypothetical protein
MKEAPRKREGEAAPYSEETYLGWGSDVLLTAEWSRTDAGGVPRWVLNGPCPRCGHADGIEVYVEIDAPVHAFGLRLPARFRSKVSATATWVRCLCSYAHDQVHRGCGQAAYVDGPPGIG